ncbi:OspB protein [Vibrio cholerae]|uniref:hypothetical protein n=1 Tax=Vibrio cholerae TaxID=666 RepID=UPI0000EF9A6A|nr:hypothetical protein [Vibrio cholerae]EGR1101236.1 OspB protein [Vibrio cholerae]EJL6292217.1 OspB protein [Vibrio cholerae]ELJ8792606.1 OspB protein [Vibrio cholerae]KNH57938.1 hypothetical protein A55_1988 [Vibrio cholerae 1587]MDV2361620.1 OspB protein [Vibrio cholerae]
MPISLVRSLTQVHKTNLLSGNGGDTLIVKRVNNNVESALKISRGLMLVIGSSGIKADHLNILGQQIPRVLNRKETYTTAFLNINAKRDFEDSIDYMKKLKVESSRLMTSKISNDQIVEILLSDAAKTQKNVIIDELDLSEFTKVYIVGHGSAGLGIIKSGDQYFNVPDIVDILEKKGILSSIKDLRFVSCQSADKRVPASMSDKDLQDANCEKGFLHRMFFGKEQSLIDIVSKEIWDRGYSDVSVSGYHGNGVFYDGKKLPLCHIRSTTIPVSDIVKRKEVRETLNSEVD